MSNKKVFLIALSIVCPPSHTINFGSGYVYNRTSYASTVSPSAHTLEITKSGVLAIKHATCLTYLPSTIIQSYISPVDSISGNI